MKLASSVGYLYITIVYKCDYKGLQVENKVSVEFTWLILNTHWRFCLFQNFDHFTSYFLNWNDDDVICTLGSKSTQVIEMTMSSLCTVIPDVFKVTSSHRTSSSTYQGV